MFYREHSGQVIQLDGVSFRLFPAVMDSGEEVRYDQPPLVMPAAAAPPPPPPPSPPPQEQQEQQPQQQQQQAQQQQQQQHISFVARELRRIIQFIEENM